MRASDRKPSLVSGRGASKLLSLNPDDNEAPSRISTRMHWAHGMTMGTARALLGSTALAKEPIGTSSGRPACASSAC